VILEAGPAGGSGDLAVLELGRPGALSLARDGACASRAARPRRGRPAPRREEVLLAASGAFVVTRDPAAARAVLGESAEVLDLVAMASLAMPEGTALPEAPPGASALERAELTRSLWNELWARLVSLPTAALAEMGWLLSAGGASLLLGETRVLAELVRRAELASRAAPGADTRPFRELFADRAEPARRGRQERGLGAPAALDESEVDRALGPSGPLAEAIGSYEDRPQQREMARAVARAFSSGVHLLVEGGTGVGKSLAYLVPAALWARRNGRPVVVSTHTKNLQSQLFTKDLPLVRRALGGTLSAALVKGRRNYLCLRKFFSLLRAAERELEPSERETLAAVVAWAVRTGTGDMDESAALQREGASSLRDKLSSEGDECRGRACPVFGRCFLQAARLRALEADVVVANHALVFAELGCESPVLPQYEEIVFDEAHHVEDVATELLGVRVARVPIMKILARLFRAPRRGEARGGTGLLAEVFAAVGKAEGGMDERTALAAHEATSAAAEYVRTVAETADAFFSAVSTLLGDDRSTPQTKRRYRASGREGPRWRRVLEAGASLGTELRELASRIGRLADLLSRREARGIDERRELALDLKAQAGLLEEAAKDAEFVLSADSPGYVYWVEDDSGASRRGGQAALCAAPVEVGPLLRERLLARKRAVVFTSATLRAGGSFGYLAGRLGLEAGEETGSASAVRADTLAVGSPFDYERSSLVLVPTYLGDPREAEDEYIEGLARAAVEVFAASRGRGMALFTSYSMLEATLRLAEPELARRGLRVLAQGRDGSREAMLDDLRAGRAGVLFGTSSFWEGVDVPGEALSCLVVARLPFHVPTEPIVQARSEALRAAGRDPFLEYDLPAAVLRLRQGFGRLIRTRSDRGVAVIADPRIFTAAYGRAFLEGLPVRPRAARSLDALRRCVAGFFGDCAGP